MNTETHLRNLRESLEVIRESIEKGLVERQRTLGFNTSAAAADFNALKDKFREAGLHEL